MPFPDDWGTDPTEYLGPFPPHQGMRPLVAYITGTTAADFEDNAYLYRDEVVDPQIRLKPADVAQHIWLRSLNIENTGAGALEISFDGFTTHWVVGAGGSWQFFDLPHGGIALRTKPGEPDTDFIVLAY